MHYSVNQTVNNDINDSIDEEHFDDGEVSDRDVHDFVDSKYSGSKTSTKDGNAITESKSRKVSDKCPKTIGRKLKKISSERRKRQKLITVELTHEEILRERSAERMCNKYLSSPYKCENCILGFANEESYSSHMTANHSLNVGDFTCSICNTVLSSLESFNMHNEKHKKRYECTICHKRESEPKAMYNHYHTRHNLHCKMYTCEECGHISRTIDSLRYHKGMHKGRIPCPECDKTFTHRTALNNHHLASHKAKLQFPCSVCSKMFHWKSSLKRHMEKHKLEVKLTSSAAYCSECNINFNSLSSYYRHMRNSLKHVSQDQLRFTCDECKKCFADKTKLRDHIEEKHLHKSYTCHICHKPSKNRVGLDQHIRNVHKGRPNNKICHYCGKGFPTKVQLESHIRTHTGERPFICEYCPSTFSQPSNLYKHNRQVHLNIKAKKASSKKTEQRDNAAKMEIKPTEKTTGNLPVPLIYKYDISKGFTVNPG